MERLYEIGSLRDHIRHLNYAVATTTCRQTLGLLRQMLSDAEMKLHAEERHSNPAGAGAGEFGKPAGIYGSTRSSA